MPTALAFLFAYLLTGLICALVDQHPDKQIPKIVQLKFSYKRFILISLLGPMLLLADFILLPLFKAFKEHRQRKKQEAMGSIVIK